MYFATLLFSLILFACSGRADLKADREAYIPLWINKVQSAAQTEAAFDPSVFDPVNGAFILREYGNFGPPADHGKEYAYLAVPGGIPGLPYQPIIQLPIYNPGTFEWISEDIVSVYFKTGAWTGFNTTTFQYKYKEYDFLSNHLLFFEPGTKVVQTAYAIADPALLELNTVSASEVPPFYICNFFLAPYCNRVWAPTGVNYWNDTGFVDANDCTAKLTVLAGQTDPCPWTFRSLHTNCIFLHAGGSARDPQTHCKHTNLVTSVTCNPSCLPACSGISANAHCQPTFPGFPFAPGSFNVIWKPTCNNGYIGDGFTCTPLNCSANGKCPGKEGSYTCSANNQCLCNKDFTPRPDLGGAGKSYCDCPAPSQIHSFQGAPICVPEGRCVDDSARQFCSEQQHNTVKCTVANNPRTQFGHCTCNYGFVGGVKFPCTCSADRRVVYSDAMAGQVCLNATECTENDDCTAPQICSIAANQTVGICGSSKRSIRSL